jgi:phosphatidylserine decarboxylase
MRAAAYNRKVGGVRTFGERGFVRIASFPAISGTMARLADARLPPSVLLRLIRLYVRAYRVDMSQVAEPIESFRTFNAFFTRRLVDGARPVAAEPGVVVSPADSKVSAIGTIPRQRRLDQIKGRSYSIGSLLGSEEDAERFTQGVHATLYLSPSMYHRVHSPVDGRIVSWRYIPGRLYPVNSLAVRHVEGLFAVNERVAVTIDSPAHGRVAVVLVGAANVGRISLAFSPLVTNTGRAAAHEVPPTPIPVARGEELGAFNLGSTVVLLIADPKLRPAGREPGEVLRMGQRLFETGPPPA